jgi:hypothetical protein
MPASVEQIEQFCARNLPLFGRHGEESAELWGWLGRRVSPVKLLLTNYHPERLVRLDPIDPVALLSRWNRNRQCCLIVVNAVATEKVATSRLFEEAAKLFER